MKKQVEKSLWFMIHLALATMLLAGSVAAQDKSTDTGANQGSDKEKKEKPQPPRKRDVEKVGSIFDDQADEFEEPTYTPPADIEAKIKAIPPIPGNIKKHLTGKYTRLDDPYATLQQTPYGPSGKIYILGDLTPKTIDETSPFKEALQKESKEERLRGLAKAIITEEVSILGILNIDELRERKFYTDEYGHVTIYYDRYIGDLPLEYGDVAIGFWHGETIESLQANVVAPPLPYTKQQQRRPSAEGRYSG